MTEENKQNCLKARYAFDKMEKDEGKNPGRNNRRKEWKQFLNEKIISGELTGYEAQLCADEFIPKKECICEGFYKPNHCPVHGKYKS